VATRCRFGDNSATRGKSVKKRLKGPSPRGRTSWEKQRSGQKPKESVKTEGAPPRIGETNARLRGKKGQKDREREENKKKEEKTRHSSPPKHNTVKTTGFGDDEMQGALHSHANGQGAKTGILKLKDRKVSPGYYDRRMVGHRKQ